MKENQSVPVKAGTDLSRRIIKMFPPWNDEDEQSRRIDESLAKQLQRSMELNARMKNRLTKFIQTASYEDITKLRAIINDQDPD